MVGKLTKLAAGVLMTHYTRSKVSTGLLGDITRAAGGDDELADRVTEANTARHAVELWTDAGLLGPAGTELCRRVADVLARFCAELTAAAAPPPEPLAPPVTPQSQGPDGPGSSMWMMVDFTGRDMIAAFPGVWHDTSRRGDRLRRQPAFSNRRPLPSSPPRRWSSARPAAPGRRGGARQREAGGAHPAG